MNKAPTISIIVPVANAGAALKRLLDALCIQTYPLQQIELILITHQSLAEIEPFLKSGQASLSYRLINQTAPGLAAAQNAGVSIAKGDILLFLDETMEPIPNLVQAHVQIHQNCSGQLVIGASRFAAQGRLDFLNIKLRSWWEEIFYSMAQAGHRYTYRDLVAGNFSIETALLNHLGLFDISFVFGANYEFGLRLLKTNIPFTFAADAICYYHQIQTIDIAFIRAMQEGSLAAQLGKNYPELQPLPPIAHFGAPQVSKRAYRPRRLHMLGFVSPLAGDGLVRFLGWLLIVAERLRLRNIWHLLFHSLMMYWYWRGVAQELGLDRGLDCFRQGPPTYRPEITPIQSSVDIRPGLARAEAQLDKERPACVDICYGQRRLGHIPAQAGAERLRGVHLRPFLAVELQVPLLQALALEKIEGTTSESGTLPAKSTSSLELPEISRVN